MFTKISIFAVLVGCLLAAHGADNKVKIQEKNSNFNSDKVIKDLSRTVSQISKRKISESSLSQKKLNEISLQVWNTYDPAFTSGWWM